MEVLRGHSDVVVDLLQMNDLDTLASGSVAGFSRFRVSLGLSGLCVVVLSLCYIRISPSSGRFLFLSPLRGVSAFPSPVPLCPSRLSLPVFYHL
jgi:hypothetical protein